MGRKQTEETKRKLSKKLKEYHKNNPKPRHQYICEKCGISFESKKIRDGRKHHCKDCKRKVPHHNKSNSLLECSKRTVQKIVKRANKGCSICGWNEASCDLHHIIPTFQGGSDTDDNAVILCPNHHRMAHTEDLIPVEMLFELSVDKTFKDWRNFYNI